MSINTEQPRLNNAGLVIQGSLASFTVNGIVHPICTVKNRQMADALSIVKALVPLRGLYNGYLAISYVESITFSTAYVTNSLLKGRVSDFSSSIIPGLISSPIVAFGEGLMANRQVNAMPYSQVLKRAIRPAGLITTALREAPFSMAQFYFAPLFEEKFHTIFPTSEGSIVGDKSIEVAAGGIAGAVSGIFTTPVDLIKTRVQTSEQPISIREAARLAYVNGGVRGLFRGCGARAFNVGLAVASMNIINHALPSLLPSAMQSKN